jgi:hypothetical protein
MNEQEVDTDESDIDIVRIVDESNSLEEVIARLAATDRFDDEDPMGLIRLGAAIANRLARNAQQQADFRAGVRARIRPSWQTRFSTSWPTASR